MNLRISYLKVLYGLEELINDLSKKMDNFKRELRIWFTP